MSTSTSTNNSSPDVATNYADKDFQGNLAFLQQWMDAGCPTTDSAFTTPAALGGEPPLVSSPANAASTSTSGHVVSSSPSADNSSDMNNSSPVVDIIRATGKPRQRPYQARQKRFQRGPRSCEHCKEAKRKCHALPGGHGCQRCAKAGVVCSYDDRFHAHGRQRQKMDECAAAGVDYFTTRHQRTINREARAVRQVGGSPITSSAASTSPIPASSPSFPSFSQPSTSSVESVNSVDWQMDAQGFVGVNQGSYTGEFEMGGLFDLTQPLDAFFPGFEPFAPADDSILVDVSFGAAELAYITGAYITGELDFNDYLLEVPSEQMEEAVQVAPVGAPELAFEVVSFEQQEAEEPRELTDEEILGIEQACSWAELMDMVGMVCQEV